MAFNSGGGGGIAQASDVALSGVANNQVLAYDGTSVKWTNKNQAGAAPHTHTISDVNGLQAALDSKTSAGALYIDGIITEGQTPPAPGIYIVRPL